jgi:hypothetical protein
MPITGYDDYVQQNIAVSTKEASKREKAKQEYDDCVALCIATNPPPDPNGWGQKCQEGCEKKRKKQDMAASQEAKKAYASIGAGAKKAGLLLPPLIISDSDLEDFAKTLKVGDFAKARLITVDTVAKLRAVLAPNRGTGVLKLVTRLRKAKIDLGGESVSLTDLAGTTQLRVSDYADLEGPSDGSKATGVAALKSAFRAGAVNDKWKEIVITVAVDAASDKETMEIPSTLKSGSQHFVTVKSTGPAVTLIASVPPDVHPSEVKWSASGGSIKQDGLKGSISRTSPKRIVAEVRARGAKKSVVVWVVWAELKGKKSGQTAFGSLQLGLQGGRDGAKYAPEARVDWLATISPDSIIHDKDRPALEAQDVHTPPGETKMRKVDFCGWEIPGQIRRKTRVGPGGAGAMVSTTTYWTPDAGGDRVSTLITSPYEPQLGPFGAYLRWPESVEDIEGVDGSYLREKTQCLLFVRVQLGDTWRICSADKACRWHLNTARKGGKWDKDKNRPDELELDNAKW